MKKYNINKAIILCGGMATRFLPLSKSIPKEMLPLYDKPILEHIVEQLVSANITDILIVLGRNKEYIPRHFTKNVELYDRLSKTHHCDMLDICESIDIPTIKYIYQDEPLGTGHALELCESYIGTNPFLLLFGDEVLIPKSKSIIEELIDTYSIYGKPCIATSECDMADVHKFGIIRGEHISSNHILVREIVEKPTTQNAPSNICYIGASLLDRSIFEHLQKLTSPLEQPLTDSLNVLAKMSKLIAVKYSGTRYDMGNPLSYFKANIDYILNFSNNREDMIDYLNHTLSNIR